MNARARRILAWIVALFLALMYLAAGVGKFQMGEAFARRFVEWGYSASFSPVVAVAEITGALLVLIPATAVYGAGIVAVVMVGAVYTHLTTGIGSPVSALIGLGLAVALVALRWQDRVGPRR